MISAWRRFLIPGLSTLVMLFVLIIMGTWQVHRLHWKGEILDQIATAEASPPIALSAEAAPFTKVFATGRFQFNRSVKLGAEVRDLRTGPTMGFYQIVPLARENARAVLVNRGWAPQTRTTPLYEPEGLVTVTGYVRSADQQGWFSASNDLATRQFYTLDPVAISTAIGVSAIEPFVLVALGSSAPGSFPEPAQRLPRPPNNHLAYVITWYGLAFALAVIFVVWIRKASR